VNIEGAVFVGEFHTDFGAALKAEVSLFVEEPHIDAAGVANGLARKEVLLESGAGLNLGVNVELAGFVPKPGTDDGVGFRSAIWLP
jgi:hypothetical protein